MAGQEKKKKLTKIYRQRKVENLNLDSKVKPKTSSKKSSNKKRSSNKRKKNNSTLKSKEKANLVIGITSIVSLMLIMVVVGELFLLNDSNVNVIGNNTNVNGINIGGMEFGDANEKITTAFSKKAEDFELTLNYEGKEWKFSKEDFVVNSNIHTILEEAYLRGTNGEYNTQKWTTNKIIKEGNSIKVAFNYVFLGLDEKIENVLSQIETKPIDSEVLFNSRSKNKFYITDEKVGYMVNREGLYEEINRQFLKGNKINIDLSLEEVAPKITKHQNEQITNLRSSFSTNVSDSTGNRKSNVRMALSKLDGLKIEPGETVSFNYLTGPHNLENGYKVATIIYNGKYVDGVGGGVCQASSTLYNALLKANIKIEEVNKHTLPVKYVPMALDAMVSEYSSDLKFTNTLSSPIFISAYCDEDKAYVDIYGEKLEDGLEIKLRSETVKTIKHGGDIIMVDKNKEYTDKVLFKGEYFRLTYPKDGYEVKAYVDYYINGELIDEVLIRHETYSPQNGIVIEGCERPIDGMNIIEGGVVINS